MDDYVNKLLDLGLKFVDLLDENCIGVFASDIDKMEKRFRLIKEIYPNATAELSLNSCRGDMLVDLTGKKYELTEINKDILMSEYIKLIRGLCDNPTDELVKQIQKIQDAYRHYLK